MQNKKGNVAVIAVIIIIVAITVSVITWLVATRQQTGIQKNSVVTPPAQTTITRKQSTPASVSHNNVIFRDTNFGFQLTMPKEWSEYAVYTNFGSDNTVFDFLLPSKQENSGYTMEVNGKKYFTMMKIYAWSPPSFDEAVKSPECKEGPCPAVSTILKRNNNYVFTLLGPQDAPNDLQGEPYMVGLNYPTNFQKYFKFELIGQ